MLRPWGCWRAWFCLWVLACSTEPLLRDEAVVTREMTDCAVARATSEGPVTGVKSRTGRTCAYLGIPFAAPPVGALRFAPPRPPLKRSGVMHAGAYHDFCLQRAVVRSTVALPDVIPILGDEDCLYLNIWRPRGEKLPVMVFIHGGAFVVGAGSWGLYEGDYLAQEGAVVVTINYRLGPLGFFASEAVAAETPEGGFGNQGILDQIRALQWVRDNIAAFGGDPGKVTIFGESAGGMSVCTLLTSPMAAGLFHRAIIESGGCKAVATQAVGFSRAASYAADTGCATGSPADQLACMRALPARELLQRMNFDIIASSLEPHVDGVVVPEVPLDALRAGRYHRVPVLGGSNMNEVQAASAANPHSFKLRNVSWVRYYQALEAFYGPQQAVEIKRFYGAERFQTPFESWWTLKSDFVLACPTLLGLQAVGNHSAAYHYIFDWPAIGPLYEILGTPHALELFFVFGTIDLLRALIPADDFAQAIWLSSQMRKLWVSFAREGLPHSEAVPKWPLVSEGTQLLRAQPSIVTEIKRAECAFWDPRLPTGLETMTDDLDAILDYL